MNNLNDINNAFKINTFQNLKSPIIICEDVFENPLEVREHALLKYPYCVKYPFGHIYTFGLISTDMIQLFRKLTRFNIKVTANHFLFTNNLLNTYPHVDIESENTIHAILASVIYLNPELNNFNCTQFYENNTSLGGKQTLSAAIAKKHIKVTSFIGNRFNKMVLYDGSKIHCPSKGFGDNDNPENMRVVATYFMDGYTH